MKQTPGGDVRSDSAAAPAVLVLGIGNTIMSDDGVGVKVVEQLQSGFSFPDNVEILDGGTLGLDLLPKLDGISHLIIVDAVETGEKPGTCVRLAGEELPILLERKISPHQMGLKDLLAVASFQGNSPSDMVLVGIQPGSIQMGLELTPEVDSQVPALKESVLRELARIGVQAVAL
jgi:hydrogenase maturation protease